MVLSSHWSGQDTGDTLKSKSVESRLSVHSRSRVSEGKSRRGCSQSRRGSLQQEWQVSEGDLFPDALKSSHRSSSLSIEKANRI